jgi:leucyl aminopeptidase
MNIAVVTGEINEVRRRALVLPYFEDQETLGEDLSLLNQQLGGTISRLLEEKEIKGKYKEITTIFSLGKMKAEKVVILGSGKKAELTLDKIRMLAADLCKALRSRNTDEMTLALSVFKVSQFNSQLIAQALVEGCILGNYTYKKHMTKSPEYRELAQIDLLTTPGDKAAVEAGIQSGKIIAEAANLARDMGNEPANFLNPAALAGIAMNVAAKYNLEITVLEKEEIQDLKMGGLLGVSQGSQQLPRFIIMNYRGKASKDIDIALIGKGITFDSGGISLKPSENMGEMKGDMAGGAAVIAAMGAIAQLKPAINVTALIPATENMPSGVAMRPGDVITIMNGKTVEIISTDAEGRLILVDALCYAHKLQVKRMVDIATLTGSCHIALGDICTGTFGNNQEFVNQIISAGAEAGECMWQLPMNEEYRELNKSDVADLKNSGGRFGGAISAAWFIREFAGDIPWIHLDIAGTSTTDKERGYLIKGNTGVPVRTLINLVLKLAEAKAG